MDLYRPPKHTPVKQPLDARAPSTPVHLYSATQVAVASFIGLPPAGAWMMASNRAALGARSMRLSHVLLAIGGTMAVLLAVSALPAFVGQFGIRAGLAWVMWTLARKAEDVPEHMWRRSKATVRPWWQAAGIGVIALAAPILFLLAIWFGLAPS